MPLALAELHGSLPVDAEIEVLVTGRGWTAPRFADVLLGAGFAPASSAANPAAERPASTGAIDPSRPLLVVRTRTLADHVSPGMRLLVCGLNPSLYAADAGVGFARPGNRFWPAALRAGIVEHDRDPLDALVEHRMGMTDLVKRATVGAAELTRAEYQDGLGRLERLVRWLSPAAVCFVGLAGWRAAADRLATAGVIDGGFAGAPAYLMPNPSGLNAHSSVDDFAAHLATAARLADGR